MDPITGAAAAKVIKDGLEKASPEAEAFASQVTGSARAELGAWFADYIRVRRLRSQLKILEKAQSFAADAGYEPGIVNLKLLVPLLEAGSLEDENDDPMLDRWASLLANASDGSAPNVQVGFPEILRQLSPTDARVLDRVFDVVAPNVAPDRRQRDGALASGLVRDLGIQEEAFAISFGNLARLGLCAPHAIGMSDDAQTEGKPTLIQSTNIEIVCLTDLGEAFVSACRPPAAD